MSDSPRHKIDFSALLMALLTALLAVLISVALAGCGDSSSDAGSSGATAGRAGSTAVTGPTGPTGSAPGSAGATGGAAVEPPRAGVVIELNGGKFAEGTPKVISIEPGIEVEIDFQAVDDRPYTVNIVAPSGPSSVQVGARGANAYVGPALKPGEEIHASYGGQRVKITANAEPGP